MLDKRGNKRLDVLLEELEILVPTRSAACLLQFDCFGFYQCQHITDRIEAIGNNRVVHARRDELKQMTEEFHIFFRLLEGPVMPFEACKEHTPSRLVHYKVITSTTTLQ